MDFLLATDFTQCSFQWGRVNKYLQKLLQSPSGFK